MAEGDSGFSQQDPSDMATNSNAQRFFIDQVIARINTIKTVKVMAVKTEAPGRGTVDVQPAVNLTDGENNATPHGTIYGIPYRSFQYGKNAVLADPAVGDIGVMVCADRDISSVKSAKDIAPPGSGRQYDNADGIYIGGLLGNEEPDQSFAFTAEGVEITAKHGNKLTSSATGWEFTGPVKMKDVVTLEGSLQLAGSINAGDGTTYAGNIVTKGLVEAGFGTADAVTLQAHFHPANGQPPTPGH